MTAKKVLIKPVLKILLGPKEWRY